MDFKRLTDEQARQLTDARQVFEAWRAANRDFKHRFGGSMRWLNRKGRDYLHRKRGTREQSLGPRSDTTEAAFAAFIQGRKAAKERLGGLAERLDQMAPVNRALGLGRVPRLTARIIRRLDEHALFGRHLLLVGTNALFAYEAHAGVQLRGGLLATRDADLLWDARQRMSLLLHDARRDGVLGLLRRVDRSFEPRGAADFRAYNRDGYWVDLIRPLDHNFFNPTGRRSLGGLPDDLHAAPVEGLHWLINGPRLQVVAIGGDGYPVPLVVPDPRVFAVHKLWLSERQDRDPAKKPRDLAQSAVAMRISEQLLGLSMDSDELSALPVALRQAARRLSEAKKRSESQADAGSEDDVPSPNW